MTDLRQLMNTTSDLPGPTDLTVVPELELVHDLELVPPTPAAARLFG